MRRINERSKRHLHRLTPETLYKGAGLAAGPKHHQAIIDAVRVTGVDPATVPLDIACAAEIHAREGAPPYDAFPIAVAHSLTASGYIDRELAKKALGSLPWSSKSTSRRIKNRLSKK